MSLNAIDFSKKLPSIKLFLAKPNKEIIGRIDKNIFNINHSTKQKDINELRFNVAIQITKQHTLVDNPYFKKIKQHYLLRVDYNGSQEWYKIQNLVKADRNKEEFSVVAFSLETELNGKKVINLEEKSINCTNILIKTLAESSSVSTAETGTNSTTIKITNHGLVNNDYIINTTRKESRKVTYVDANTFTVDSITSQSSGDTIEKYKNATNWTIGTITDSFNTTYRDFESNVESALDYIQNTIAATFKGVASFDTNNRTISIVDESTIGSDKGLPVKFGQYMLGVEQDSNAQQINTRIYPYGKSNLTISRTNPNGKEYIDDFSHFTSEDYMTSGLISALNTYNALLTTKKSISDVAEAGTNTITLVMNSHGLVVGDFIVNRTRSRATRKVLTVVDVNTVTVSSVTGQTANDSIDKYGSSTFGKLLFQKEDYQADLVTKNNELDTLRTQKLTVLDRIAIQIQAKTIDSFSNTVTNTSVTRTLSGLNSGDKFAAMVRVSSTVGTTVTLNGVNKTFTADTWSFLGKVTSATSHTIVVTTTGTNVNVKTLIVKTTNDEYTGLVANPITPPTLSQTVNGSSTLVAGTYYVKYSWTNGAGETLVSPEASVTVGTGYNLVVTLPSLPSGVTGANIYIGTTLGAETKQGNTTTTTYTQSVALISGSSVPASNTATYANESVLIDTYSEDYKQSQITLKQSEINTTNTNITSKDAEISSLRTSLSYESNFTSSQLEELKNYTYADEFRDENIIDDKDLYVLGESELKKRNIPQILYKIDIVAFEQSITEQRNWKKLNIGDTVTIVHDKLGINIKSKILEIERDFENVSVNLVIGNSKEILTDDDKLIKSIYSSIKTTNSLNNKQSGYDTTKTNFTNRNDRISVAPANPIIISDGTAIDHVINDDGSVDISFEWSYTGSGDAYDIDGFTIYTYSSPTDIRYIFGSAISGDQIYDITPDKRAFVLQGVPANKYYNFGIQAYRVVDEDINSNGILKSDIVQPSLNTENPYRPESNVAFAGNITGTIDGTASSTVVSNASNGQTTYTQTANSIRNGTVVTDPSIILDGTAIDHVINTDSSSDISFEWTYTEPANSPIDGFGVVVYSDTSNAVHAPNISTDTVYNVDKNTRSFILNGVPINKHYTFGVFAYRIVDTTINTAGILRSSIVKSTFTGENPYQPSASVAFSGDITGTINGTSASTVVSNASNGNNAWGKFSGVGNTLPSGNVEFNFATSSSKGGNATNTDNVGTQTALAVQGATLNFNSRNDRNSTTPSNPVIATDETAIDHTVNTDGSVDISFEWSFIGTGDAYDIDGFVVYSYSSSSSSIYSFGTTPSSEQVFFADKDKRAFILYGVPSDKHYTFGVQSYRAVDNDISASGFLKSGIVKPTIVGENPYQPLSAVAFAGNITGSVNGVAASTLTTQASNGDSAKTILDTDKPTWDTTSANFDSRNDRISTIPANPNISSDGTALDHVINTEGSCDISFEWGFTGMGNSYNIDGFIVYIRQSTSNTPYTLGTTDVANEQAYIVDKDKRAFILYGVSSNKYYTFGIQAYRIVDQDINSSGILKSSIIQPSNAGEVAYLPSATVAFSGNITGTVNGTAASTVSTSVTNFNSRNDRKNTVPANPTILTDATAIDHTINTDGSADISFEWGFTGTGDAYDIDGFIIYVSQKSTSESYSFGTTPSNEQVFYVTPEKRAFILYGVAANKYYTFGVQSYRIVDADINSSSALKSNIIKPSIVAENPYLPSSNVAFTGDVTGTIGGINYDEISKSPVTYIIADGSTSSNIKKADFVVAVGATNAQVTINNVINSLGANGGKIILLDGTYTIDGSINPTSNVEIEGVGSSTIIKAKNSVSAAVNIFSSTTTKNNIKIRNLTIDGNYTNNNSYQIKGFHISSCSKSKFEHINFVDIRYGFYMLSCSDVGVSKNSFSTIANDLNDYAISVNNSSKIIVSENTLQTGMIYMSSTTSSVVSGNVINSKYSSINLYLGCNKNTIASNTCTSSMGGNGIILDGSSNNTISSNVCNGCWLHGMHFANGSSNNSISSNTIEGNAQNSSGTNLDGINVYAGSNYNSIQNNIIRRGSGTYQQRYGIRIENSTCVGNIVTNNDLYQSGATGSFSDVGTSTVTISGNRI